MDSEGPTLRLKAKKVCVLSEVSESQSPIPMGGGILTMWLWGLEI